MCEFKQFATRMAPEAPLVAGFPEVCYKSSFHAKWHSMVAHGCAFFLSASRNGETLEFAHTDELTNEPSAPIWAALQISLPSAKAAAAKAAPAHTNCKFNALSQRVFARPKHWAGESNWILLSSLPRQRCWFVVQKEEYHDAAESQSAFQPSIQPCKHSGRY